MADSTAAAGLGVLLTTLTGDPPLLVDEGPRYALILDKPVDLETLPYKRLIANPGYLYVKRGGDPEAPREGVLDYESEQSKAKAAREARKTARARAKLGELTESGTAGEEARADWYLFQELNVLQAYGSYNGLHAAVRRADPAVLGGSVKLKLEALAHGRGPDAVDTEFSYPVSPVQGFNPLVGKGVNRRKPDGAPVASLDKGYADWFEEWLRYAGTHVVANAAGVGDDIKFMALAPKRMRHDCIRRFVRPEFLSVAASVWTSSQLDVCLSLRVARRLVEGSGFLGRDAEWELSDYRPNDLISGIHTAYFKKLGAGRAVSNLAFIGLPGWFPVSDRKAAEDWLTIIDEHLGVVAYLREDRTEQYALIVLYRDFLSGGDVRSFLAFSASYATYLISAREGGRPVKAMTTTSLEKVVVNMEKAYAGILESEGFRNIARAMRRATVNEQFRKRSGDQTYQIHYGLFHELRRASGFKDRLVRVVSDFVGSYNAENARAEERAASSGRPVKRRRAQVTTGDIQEFVALVDQFDSETIGYLLIAYASAREPREGVQSEAEDVASADHGR